MLGRHSVSELGGLPPRLVLTLQVIVVCRRSLGARCISPCKSHRLFMCDDVSHSSQAPESTLGGGVYV